MTPFIINHLWQSSCFALVAGLLAFALRKHSPKVARGNQDGRNAPYAA